MAKKKAISLLSGGLDSTLATKLILDQGIEVIGLFLESPFGCKDDVSLIAEHLGIRLITVQKGMDYVDLVRNPKYGYGKNMNPCIDCRIYMFKIAQQVMDAEGADFIITGEVLGQRPMSQRKEAMAIIDRDSQSDERILRPLSAQFFPPTLMEREGWVDRDKLLNLTGRSRSEQLKWAERLKLKGYAAPAGGCLLTDANFSARLSEFFDRTSAPTMTEVRLLRLGRHFNLSNGAHLILGRNAEESEELWEISRKTVLEGEMTFFRADFSGPDAVLSGKTCSEISNEVSHLIAKYSNKSLVSQKEVEVVCGKSTFIININFPYTSNPLSKEELPVIQ